MGASVAQHGAAASSDTAGMNANASPRIEVLAVCTGHVHEAGGAGTGARRHHTASPKTLRQGRVAVKALGLEGDEQADLARHGGIAKAVYAYPQAHHDFWRTVRAQAQVAAWDTPVPPGLFGENLLIGGIREHGLWIGDRLRGPDVVFAVSEPRLPCAKFDVAMGFKAAGKLMAESGFCGAYLAVIDAGSIGAGDVLVLQSGPREVNLRDLFRAKMGRA
jgi:MOSC domain-containing protein YiiM